MQMSFYFINYVAIEKMDTNEDALKKNSGRRFD